MITVYGLTDPLGQIWYIGQTGNPRQRFAAHRSEQKTFTVSGMAILAEFEEWEEASYVEAKWIAFFGLDNLMNKWEGMLLPNDPPEIEEEDLSPEPPVLAQCKVCNKQFEPVRDWQIYCSEACREAWYKKVYETFKKYRQRKARTV